jgi:hypothetical protein
MKKKEIIKKKPKEDWSDRQTKAYLNKRLWNHFCKWMLGQTCPVLPNGKHGFFKWDVERYANFIFEGKPTYWD